MDRTPFLTGENVDLYPVEESDLEQLRDIVNHEDVWQWISISQPQNMRSEQQFYEALTDNEDQVTLLVYAKDEEQTVGTVGLRMEEEPDRVADLGLMLDADHHSKGIGTEAARLMVGYGFDTLGLHRVWARALATNEKSIGLLENVGFTEEGRFREHKYHNGTYRDVVLFGLLQDDWRN